MICVTICTEVYTYVHIYVTIIYIYVHIRWSMWLSSIYMYISDVLCDYLLYICTYQMICVTIIYNMYISDDLCDYLLHICTYIDHLIHISFDTYICHTYTHTLVNVVYMYDMPYTYTYIQASRCKHVCMYVWIGAYSSIHIYIFTLLACIYVYV